MIPVFDGHLDSLQALYLPGDNSRSLLTESKEGHFDLPRAQKGHFAGGLFAIKESNGVVGINFCTGFLRKDVKLAPDTSIENSVKHITYGVEKWAWNMWPLVRILRGPDP